MLKVVSILLGGIKMFFVFFTILSTTAIDKIIFCSLANLMKKLHHPKDVAIANYYMFIDAVIACEMEEFVSRNEGRLSWFWTVQTIIAMLF